MGECGIILVLIIGHPLLYVRKVAKTEGVYWCKYTNISLDGEMPFLGFCYLKVAFLVGTYLGSLVVISD